MSDNSTWRPLSAREQGAKAEVERDALHEGVPDWLKSSLFVWIKHRLADPIYSGWSNQKLMRLERELRLPLEWQSSSGPGSALVGKLNSDPDLCLDVVDYLLRDLRWPRDRDDLMQMFVMLREAGSAWEVSSTGQGDECHCLQRRVPETVDAAARQAFTSGRPGEHLQIAWGAAYGRSPNPSEAYGHAVRAVEVAAYPIVTPKDPKPSLGKMITALRDAPEKWEVVLGGAPDSEQVEVVRLMADLLWKAHTDRHGAAVPVPIDPEQAEAAVHLAVLLVQWFTTGSIRPVGLT